ncbi:hypothetical protein SAMN05216502_1217 [Citrobacter amalonaticus]|jgi:hypothetical protein|nr:hypothetical protein SAMN05216502_1217 [Citrobacter amalonaticus]SUX59840.1 Uncharacterised protein [Citrobacter amalonaticus]
MPILIISFIRKINRFHNEGTNVMLPSGSPYEKRINPHRYFY